MQFPNRMKDELGNYLSLTNGWLWRRDSAHLFAVRLTDNHTGHADYEWQEQVNQATLEDIGVDADLNLKLTFKGDSSVKQFTPCVKTKTDTLQFAIKKDHTFHHEYAFHVAKLKTILMIMEQKWEIEDEKEPKLIFDFDKQKIKMENREEEFDFPIDEKMEKKEGRYCYSFYFFKDMIYNKFKQYIFFRISDKYTILEYDKNVMGMLMHAQLTDDHV